MGQRSLKVYIDALRIIGPRNAVLALRYGWTQKALDRRRAPPPPDAAWVGPGRAVEGVPSRDGLLVRFEQAEVRLRALAADLLEVTWREPPAYLPVPDRETDPVSPVAKEVPGGWSFRTGELAVLVTREGGILLDGLREELPPLFRGEEVRHAVRLAPDERLHGLGERAAPLDLRGGLYRLWNRDPQGYGPGDDPLYLCVPVYVSRGRGRGYLAFYANCSPGVIDAGKTDPDILEHRFEGGGLRYYVVPGPLDRALERYTELTGRPPLPPLWALGYHQSRWSYYPDARVRKLARDFSEHEVPVDAIHLDIHHLDGYRVFTVDRRRFPDLSGLARDLRDQGLRLVVIVDPGLKVDRGYAAYRELIQRRAYVSLPDGRPAVAPVWPGPCAFPDFTSAAVREWWGGLYEGLLGQGVSGFWHDMNEPAVFSASGDPTLPRRVRHAAGDHGAVHNLYGLYMCQAGYAGLRRLAPARRPFIVSRSGWAGLQRYAWTWTADIRSDWPSLRQTVRTILGLGLSGIPFSGSDAGGFTGDPGPELYVRWLQAAAFHAFFRSHTSALDPDQEPWSYGEPYTSAAREAVRLRYALLPYVYTAAWEAASRGWPLVRPLFWPAPGAAGGRTAVEGSRPAPIEEADDAFLLGADLLVAPVLEPGATGREVPLPAGDWYDFWSDELVTGPGVVWREAPLERIPLLARAGAVLPAEDPAPSVDRRTLDRLYLHVYPPAAGEERLSRLYSDAGDGYGPYRVDVFRLRRDESGGRLEFAWEEGGPAGPADRRYPWPYRETVLVLHGAPPGRPARPQSRVGERPGETLTVQPSARVVLELG